MVLFKEIRFGDQDAYKDDLLSSCFIDQGLIQKILSKKINFVIGPKGAGKSAVARHLLNYIDSNNFITPFNIDNFYKMKRLLQPFVEKEGLEFGELAWKVVLIDTILQSLGTDHSLFDKKEWHNIEKIYSTSFGSLKSNLPKRERRFEIGLPKIFGPLIDGGSIAYTSKTETKVTTLFQIESACDELLSNISTLHIQNNHYMLIDKVDDKYDTSAWFLELIKGLIIQTDKLSSINKGISIICFLRDDINRRIYFSNFNKLSGQTFIINWGKRKEDAIKNLGLLIKKRIEGFTNSLRPLNENPWKSFHDLYFSAITAPPKEASPEYLIERTLWRPRDVIEYCNSVHKEFSEDGLTNSTDRTKILQALRTAEYKYSQYFLQELIDSSCTEINAIAPIETLKNIMMNLRQRTFDKDDWNVACNHKGIPKEAAHKCLKIFYEHGAIGLWDETNDEVWWHHRTGAGAFNEDFKFNIHPGLLKIFQIY